MSFKVRFGTIKNAVRAFSIEKKCRKLRIWGDLRLLSNTDQRGHSNLIETRGAKIFDDSSQICSVGARRIQRTADERLGATGREKWQGRENNFGLQ